MAPAAVGAAVVAMGASAAAGAVVAAAVTAAYIGAAVGFAMSIVTGGNPLEGALKGAAIGAVTGAIGGAVAPAATGVSGAGAGVEGVGAGAAGAGVGSTEALTALEAAGAQTAQVGPTIAAAQSAGGAAGGVTAVNTAANTAQTVAKPTAEGFLGKAVNWIGNNPEAAKIVGQGVAGAGKGMLDARTSEKEIDALMERDRLNRDAIKIKGLSDLKLKTTLPTISGFTQAPAWQSAGVGVFKNETAAA